MNFSQCSEEYYIYNSFAGFTTNYVKKK